MDVNGTRFQLLLGYDDWADCSEDGKQRLRSAWKPSAGRGRRTGLAWDGQRDALTMRKHPFHFVAAPRDGAPTLDTRRGVGRDRYGNWYWIDDTRGTVLVKSSGTGNTARFWTPGDGVACERPARFGDFQPAGSEPPPAPMRLSGLAVTAHHYLVVGVLEPPGLLIFDLHAGGPPRQLLWPVDFAPFDMASAPGGGVWILDRDPAGEGRAHRYWALDRAFNVVWRDSGGVDLDAGHVESFRPVDGSPPVSGGSPPHPEHAFPTGISLDVSSPIQARHPVAIEGLPDGTVLILDSEPGQPFSTIYRYRFGQQLGDPVSTRVVLDVMEEADFRLLGHDFAFVPEQRDAGGAVLVPDRLYIAASDGNQSFAFNLSAPGGALALEALAMYLPMRLFGGKGLVTAGDLPYYDFGNGWIPLVEQPRSQYDARATLYTPIGTSNGGRDSSRRRAAFDGREPDCVWHRLMLDACIPHDTAIQVSSRAANDERELAKTAWQPEPPLYLRRSGSEQPFLPPSTVEGDGTWELLFQRARGRFLQLRLSLTSNGRSTPTIRALRAYYPRFSYLDHYLPGAYRAEEEPASFLDRFLANFEGIYTDIEDKIANVQILFDVRSAPSDVLPWLAAWYGLALDPAWDDTRRRLFIKHAMTFFQYRGTIRGIMMALRLALDACPDDSIFSDRPDASSIRIVEKYLTRRGPAVLFGDPTDGSGLQLTSLTDRWQSVEGAAGLSRRYGAFLHQLLPQKYPTNVPRDFPLSPPPDPAEASGWRQFAQSTLGFVPSATHTDLPSFKGFLARRYGRVGALSDAYGLDDLPGLPPFAGVELPAILPPDGAPLQDWYQFETVVLPMRRNAHRFTVLIPVASEGTAEDHLRRLQLAQRVTDLQKPAHTVFDVKSYWAAFIVGQVRLGTDTLVDLGSRSPQFMSPMVLGQGALAETYLAAGPPQDAPDRQILGRDRLGQ